MEVRDLRRPFRLSFALAFWGIVGGVTAIFCAFPLERLDPPPVALVLLIQEQGRALLALLWPLASAAVLGAGVGVTELASYKELWREAISARWGRYLVLLNTAVAALAYIAVRAYMPEADPFLLAISVGVGFPALIRTKFTLVKQFGGEGGSDVAVNLGWLYDQFQNFCRQEIDKEIFTFRQVIASRLIEQYPTIQELYQLALYTLKTRTNLALEEEEVRLKDLQELIDPQVPPEVARINLGLFVLELGGVGYVYLLIQVKAQKETSPMASAAAPIPSAASADSPAETVVKKLVELPLADLEKLALDLLKSPDEQGWVKQAAEPASGISEVRQKAPIAYYVVSRVGEEAASQALKNRD